MASGGSKGCVLCANPEVVVVDVGGRITTRTGSLGSFETPSASHGGSGSNITTTTTPVGTSNTWGTFLLTKLFNLEEEDVRELFQTGGVADDGWIRICEPCVGFVRKFRERHETLLEIQREMASMRKLAMEKLFGLRVEHDGVGKERVGHTTRMYFRGVFHFLANHSTTEDVSNLPDVAEPEQVNDNAAVVVGGGSEMKSLGQKETGPPPLQRDESVTSLEQDADAENLMTYTTQANVTDEQAQRNVAVAGSSEITVGGGGGLMGSRLPPGGERKATLDVDADDALRLTPAEPMGNRPSHIGGEPESVKDICGNTSASNNTRRQPGTRSADTGKLSYSCTVCRKSFTFKSKLSQHLLVHKSVFCKIRKMGFSGEGELQQHAITTHNNQRRFLCNLCDKGFTRPVDLRNHMTTHTKVKPHVCIMCEKGFSKFSNLSRHIRTHTGEKPYFCKACGADFSQSSSLVDHIRDHTNERPYKCGKCGMSFKGLAHLKRHNIRKGHLY